MNKFYEVHLCSLKTVLQIQEEFWPAVDETAVYYADAN